MNPPRRGFVKPRAGAAPPAGKPAPAKPAEHSAQMVMFGDVLPNGAGNYLVVPRKPVREIGSAEAAKLLQVSRSSLSNIVNQPLAQRILRWRWASERQGKRIFEVDSVLRYREALQNPEIKDEALNLRRK